MTTQEKEIELDSYLQQIHRGANWFYWMVGLSLVNAVLVTAKADLHFILGLAYSDFASALLTYAEGSQLTVIFGAVALLFIILLFLFIGKKSHQPSKGFYLAGIILYGIDGLIYLAFEDYLSAIFHIYVIYNLWMGYKWVGPYLDLYNEATSNFHQAEVAAEPITDYVEEKRIE